VNRIWFDESQLDADGPYSCGHIWDHALALLTVRLIQPADDECNGDISTVVEVRRTAPAASCSLFPLPHFFRAAAATDEQLVYRCSTVLACVLPPAASRRLLDVFTA
jgi:hypothetical protein